MGAPAVKFRRAFEEKTKINRGPNKESTYHLLSREKENVISSFKPSYVMIIIKQYFGKNKRNKIY